MCVGLLPSQLLPLLIRKFQRHGRQYRRGLCHGKTSHQQKGRRAAITCAVAVMATVGQQGTVRVVDFIHNPVIIVAVIIVENVEITVVARYFLLIAVVVAGFDATFAAAAVAALFLQDHCAKEDDKDNDDNHASKDWLAG